MKDSRHIPTLDGLRGLAALGVVWYHFPQVGESRVAAAIQKLSQITLSGALAVDTFFVLSGFLITRIILREVAAGTFSLRTFLIKRGLRIFPIYYVTLLLVACWQPIRHQWVAAACYVSNYSIPFDTSPHMLGHTWSLAVEEQFYLIWPLLFVLLSVPTVRRIAWPWGPLVALLAAAGTFLTIDSSLAWGLVYRGLPFRMLSLLLGATFAFHETAIRRWPTRLVGSAAFVCYAATLAGAFGFQQTAWSGFRWSGILLSACTSFLVVQFVVGANERPHRLRRLLTSSPLLWAGRASYGIYLYHHVVLFSLFNPLGADPRTLTVSGIEALLLLALCLGIPLVSYVLIEKPLLHLKARLTPSHSESGLGNRSLPEFQFGGLRTSPPVMASTDVPPTRTARPAAAHPDLEASSK